MTDQYDYWSLHEKCTAWDGSPDGFAHIVKVYLVHHSARALADAFECMVSSVTRYAEGSSRPHAKLQAMIVQWIGEHSYKSTP